MATATYPTALIDMPLEQLTEHPAQPRQDFSEEKLLDLIESVTAVGVQVPLQVRSMDDGTYRVIDGARRLRAATAAGLSSVPVIVQTVDDWKGVLQQQILANALREDLTPLEDAQALHILWLGEQIAALEHEQDLPPDETETLVEAMGNPTIQIGALGERLCELAGTRSVEAYAQSGRVRVAWSDIMQRAGRGNWSESQRKKQLALLHLSPEVQEALAGKAASARTLRTLASQQPAEQEQVVKRAVEIQQNSETDDDFNAALRQAMQESALRGSGNEAGTAGSHQGPTSAPAEGDLWDGTEEKSDFVPDPTLAMPFSKGGGKKLISERGEIEHGTPPPPGHEFWPADNYLVVRSGMEAILNELDTIGPGYLTESQRLPLASMWREICSRLQQAGIEDE